MKIKESNTKKVIPEVLINFIKGKLKRRRIAFGVAVFILYSLFLLACGAVIHKKQIIGMVIKPAIKENIMVPVNYLRSFTARPEHLYLNIKHIDYQRLTYYRQLCLKNGEITDYAKEAEVNAELVHKGKRCKVKLSLTGTLLDHVKNIGDKWSFRVRVRNGETVLGMSEFNLQHPRTRCFIDEWIINELERREGNIALRFDFVDISINGKHKGIYLIEEHLDKELMGYNNRPEGILFGYKNKKIYQLKQNLKDPALIKQMALFKEIYNPVDYPEINRSSNVDGFAVSKVFDLDRLAAHYALSDLVCGLHQHSHWNVFYYFNPVTSLLEPIGRERNKVYALDVLEAEISDEHWTAIVNKPIFDDPAFFRKYIQALERISEPAYLDDFFKEIGPKLECKLNTLYKEYPWMSFSKNIYYDNQKVIKKRLTPFDAIECKYRGLAGGGIEITARNTCTLPIEIVNITSFDYLVFPTASDKILWPDKKDRVAQWQDIKFKVPKDLTGWLELGNLKINYRVLGASNLISKQVLPFTYNDIVRSEPNYHRFGFIESDPSAKIISIKPGNWTLSDSLIIPKGYVFICPPGVKINLIKSAKILSWSPLKFIGSQEKPIIISSEDSTGQGVVVLKAGEESDLEYVYFENLSAPCEIGWELRGVITFYESPVNIDQCSFSGNRSGDDFLNIIRTKFTIENSLFKKVFADALDIDFSQGNIGNCEFINSGNDAIDFSGSIVKLEAITIDGADDKGISVGEKTKITARQIIIKNANLGVASKDMSEIGIKDLSLAYCNIGFSVFQKKSEFGPARMNIEGLSYSNVANLHLIENGSLATIDGIAIEGKHKGLAKRFYSKP